MGPSTRKKLTRNMRSKRVSHMRKTASKRRNSKRRTLKRSNLKRSNLKRRTYGGKFPKFRLDTICKLADEVIELLTDKIVSSKYLNLLDIIALAHVNKEFQTKMDISENAEKIKATNKLRLALLTQVLELWKNNNQSYTGSAADDLKNLKNIIIHRAEIAEGLRESDDMSEADYATKAQPIINFFTDYRDELCGFSRAMQQLSKGLRIKKKLRESGEKISEYIEANQELLQGSEFLKGVELKSLVSEARKYKREAIEGRAQKAAQAATAFQDLATKIHRKRAEDNKIWL